MASERMESEEFLVIRTSRGLSLLDDPMQISIYKTVSEIPGRPNDLSAKFNIPSSSLQFNINKMLTSGTIERVKLEDNRKSVYYSARGQILMRSSCPDHASFQGLIESFSGERITESRLSFILTECMSSIGLDLLPMIDDYIISFADEASEGMTSETVEDAVIEMKRLMKKYCGSVEISVFGFNPLIIIVSGGSTMPSCVKQVSNLICRWICNISGQEFVLNGLSDMPTSKSDHKYKLQYNRVPKCMTSRSTIDEEDKESERFYMALTKEGLKIVRGGIRADIISSIRHRPMNMSEIVQATKSPRSTVVSNVSRMLEEGFLTTFEEGYDTVHYGIGCDILLDNYGTKDASTEFSHSFTDHGLLEGGYRYICSRLESIGFDPTTMMYQCGRLFAKYDTTPTKSASDLMKRIGAEVSSSDDTMSLLTVVPADDRGMDRYKASFICGMMMEMYDNGSNKTLAYVGDASNGNVTI